MMILGEYKDEEEIDEEVEDDDEDDSDEETEIVDSEEKSISNPKWDGNVKWW